MWKISVAALLALSVAAPAGAYEPFEWTLEEDHEFVGFRDPGVLILKSPDGKTSEIDFDYQGLTYDVVQSWPKGKPVRVAYSPEGGTEVVDPASGERYPIRSAMPPIDDLMRRCQDGAGTTVGLSECHNGAAAAWDVELNRAYQQVLKSGLSDETKGAIRAAQRKWIAFRDASLAATRAAASEKGGSIRILEVGSSMVLLTRHQVLRLRGYLD